MTEYVMRLTGELDKVKLVQMAMKGQEPSWRYLRWFDPDGMGGRGLISTTGQLSKAKRFASLGAVFEEWKRQSTTVPLRDDGKPNRPLTAYTMEPFKVPS